MGDTSELRILLVVICFMACFTIITQSGLAAFNQVGKSYKELEIPAYMDATQLLNITADTTQYLTGTQILDFSLNGIDFTIITLSDKTVLFYHRVLWGGLFYQYHSMLWYNETGSLISYEAAGENYLAMADLDEGGYPNGAQFTITCEHLSMPVGLSYDPAYSSFVDAYEFDSVVLWSGLGWEEAGTVQNAWNLIGSLFWFQTPEIHPVINLLIHIPMYISIGYVSYILILRAIGAVFGGGGA